MTRRSIEGTLTTKPTTDPDTRSPEPTDVRLQRSVMDAAIMTARSLRATADRLEDAARSGDFARLSELAIPMNVWTVDKIAGAALALVRLGKVTP